MAQLLHQGRHNPVADGFPDMWGMAEGQAAPHIPSSPLLPRKGQNSGRQTTHILIRILEQRSPTFRTSRATDWRPLSQSINSRIGLLFLSLWDLWLFHLGTLPKVFHLRKYFQYLQKILKQSFNHGCIDAALII